jgi:hypothetical protein
MHISRVDGNGRDVLCLRTCLYCLGFHLLRQDRTITWPIDEFLTRAAGGSEVDIERLSQEFFTVAARSRFVSHKERRKEPE